MYACSAFLKDALHICEHALGKMMVEVENLSHNVPLINNQNMHMLLMAFSRMLQRQARRSWPQKPV